MISVCIATYNASKYINAQIASVLLQLSSDDEVVISDDVSTDDTIDVIKAINDSRIKIIVGKSRLGVVKNFERCLYAANGDLIFLCDQDDIWLPKKVNECKSHLVSNLLVVTDCIVVDSNLNHLYESFFTLRKSKKGILQNIYKNTYIGCCMAFKRELLDYALPIPEKVSMHDIWLGILAEIWGDVVFLPEKLVLYRRHDNNASLLETNTSIFKKVQIRIYLIANLFIRLISVLIMQRQHR